MNTQKSLQMLCEKYAVPAGTLLPGNRLRNTAGNEIALLPHRVERRFVELRNLIANRTLEDLSTLRFAELQAGGTLAEALERELDLAEFFGGAPVISVFASGDERNLNLIVKLGNDRSVSIELSTGLPAGSAPIDRHELIASRGVASDRTVDTQVPQSSIYLFAEGGNARFTDTDAELFGLIDQSEVTLVRAAFAVLADPALGEAWNRAATQAKRLAAAAMQSAKSGTPVKC